MRFILFILFALPTFAETQPLLTEFANSTLEEDERSGVYQVAPNGPEFEIKFTAIDEEPASFGKTEIFFGGEKIWKDESTYYFEPLGVIDITPDDQIWHILTLVEIMGNSGLTRYALFEIDNENMRQVMKDDALLEIPVDLNLEASAVLPNEGITLERNSVYGLLEDERWSYAIEEASARIIDYWRRPLPNGKIVFDTSNYTYSPADAWIDIPVDVNSNDTTDYMSCQIWSRWQTITNCVLRLDDERNIDITKYAEGCRRFGIDWSDEETLELYGTCNFEDPVLIELKPTE